MLRDCDEKERERERNALEQRYDERRKDGRKRVRFE